MMRAWVTVQSVLMISALAVGSAQASEPLRASGKWEEPSFGQAPLPPMGWNSWNAFHTQIDEQKLMGSAQALIDTGLAETGYRYVNIDDGWWQKRRQSDGELVIRTSIFPSATGSDPDHTSFKPLVSRLHAMGLKAGIYSDIGRNACSQGYPQADSLLPTGSVLEREVGLFGHEVADLTLYFNTWGFDYIKVDGCGLNAFSEDKAAVMAGEFRAFPALVVSDSVNQTQVEKIKRMYQTVRDTLIQLRPNGDFVLSLCNWGTANVRAWGRQMGNLWRTSDDIEPRWSRMLYNFDSVATRELYSGPGHWNDPDMLYIGHGEFDEHHLTEAKTHMSLWAIEDAPLLIGYDLRTAPQSMIDVLGAKEVIAIDQDPLGNQGVIEYTSDDLEIIVKQLSKRNEKAVVIFNRGTETIDAMLTADHLKMKSDQPVQLRDVWSRTNLDPFVASTHFVLKPRESRLLKAIGTPQLADGMYLSEIPARLYVANDGIDALQGDPYIHRPTNLGDETTKGTGSRAVLAGFGAPRVDSTPYNLELRLRDHVYSTGIGALANSRLQVHNLGEFKVLSAQVGIDNSSLNKHSRVQFEVYGDGHRLYQSKALGFMDAPEDIHVDIQHTQVVELIARQVSGHDTPTVITWGSAAVHY